ncbi:Major facilitator superfamily domain, general substrate transporter [Cordyceps fumosorosea ARSEF 2679]|uniref:Major facilitator superfamily domain, general substrate transporter n=1 Tax=Cordyceps fumosorosea (strain ARSEF 2679) TaxID=1081104 RepID=A0A167T0P6_CORFA|nr:Major facilitator superfamily domain, general substrate transporter [Cordyceps fumosorosea ARSEF 2679]OAA60127.1 Major facilitator superfamily domain, general substrate transporter [Cordyceps fumosorosea ARSEF 2679]
MAPKEQDQIVRDEQTAQPLDQGAMKSLLRKIDMYLLPVMAASYMFQFLDKSALSNAAILGIRADLRLSGGDYSWASAIYYFGFLVASYPIGWIMVRMPVAKFMAVCIALWGGTLMLMALPRNAAGLLTVRFLLGVLEASLGPGLTVIVAMWYRRAEQPLRHAAWFAGNSVAGILGGIAAYGISHIRWVAPWKALFLLLGAATFLFAGLVLYMLPDVPAKARFLSKRERDMAVARVRDNMTGIRNNVYKWYQVREALLDTKTWLMAVVQLGTCIANGASSFTPIVINGFGFTTLNTLLLSSGEFLSQLCFMLLVAWISSRIPNSRTYFLAGCILLGVLGGLLIRQLPPAMRWGRYAGLLVRAGFPAYFPLLLAMLSGNTAGFTKKTTTNAVIFMATCIGNIIGPLLYFGSEAPGYSSGFLSLIICLGISFMASILLRLHLTRENRRRDTEQASGLGDVAALDNLDDEDFNEMDLTDKEMPRFRYVY